MRRAIEILRDLRRGDAETIAPEAAEPSCLSPLDRFLADASIQVAVMHSPALSRDFVLARDEAALEALTEAGRALPVLYVADRGRLAGLGARDLAVILDVREALGPSIVLTTVRPRLT